ncbi:HprK-related kinase B [Stieleria sp. TO1_6]|uniref:HprK-related kinase B n=1 Tax=Stieleria tagensis TaxID=2956795 RepID=UPI00209B2A1F|nr:HprK-related kinase B [Stieleria tagensis]MCO8122200.1 HprK-related kinase B [Stieleria tagensis]
MRDALAAADRLTADFEMSPESVLLDLDGFHIEIRSNCTPLLDRLRGYFSHALGSGPATVTVSAIETSPIDLQVEFSDWYREPGKTGRKDSYHDLIDGRLVRKVRTGMLFLQSNQHRIAAGPCFINDNQVINFINSQYMNWLQQHDAVICHAAGVVLGDTAMAIAGFSGGGKSSLMLRIMEQHQGQFLSNDRLFVQADGERRQIAIGIPKMPRINPGTILSLPSLESMLDPGQRKSLKKLDPNDLWELEQKYDVPIESLYGSGRIRGRAPLTDLMVLNWDRRSNDACTISAVDLTQRLDLLPAITKSAGPFYCNEQGEFRADATAIDPQPYLDRFRHVNVWEASGTVDFDFASQQCREIMESEPCEKTY